MIENGEVSVKLARIDGAYLVDLDGNQYFLHAAECDAINCGEQCDCLGGLVLDEILTALSSKETS